MRIDDKSWNPGRVFLGMLCVGLVLLSAQPLQAVSHQTRENQASEDEIEQARLLIEQILNEGITQADLASSTPVMQDLAEGRISEHVARARIKRVGDGKLVRFLSNRLLRHLFRRADPSQFFRSLADRGLNTTFLEEMQPSINFYFRPQTDSCAAQWEYVSNTLFIPVEFARAGTNQVRTDLLPHEVNILIHELDHAEKDFRFDLFTLRGKSFWRKIHAGICWGGIIGFCGLFVTTLLGSLHRLHRLLPVTRRLSRLSFLTLPQTALIVIVGAPVVCIAIAGLYHICSPYEFSHLSQMARENQLQVRRIAQIIEANALNKMAPEVTAEAREQAVRRQIRDAVGFGIPGALGGAALGLLLGSLGLGPRLMGSGKFSKALGYSRAMAITCGVIGLVSFACIGAWRINQYSKLKAWEVSAYYAGDCVQKVLQGQQDIVFHNTNMLRRLSLEELKQLQELDDNGQLKLLLPDRMFRIPNVSQHGSAHFLAQLASDFPGNFDNFGVVEPGFQSYLVGVPITFPYEEHPHVFESLFRTSLGLELERLTVDRDRNEFNCRGLADFMEQSELPFFEQIRNQVRAARSARIGELADRQDE